MRGTVCWGSLASLFFAAFFVMAAGCGQEKKELPPDIGSAFVPNEESKPAPDASRKTNPQSNTKPAGDAKPANDVKPESDGETTDSLPESQVVLTKSAAAQIREILKQGGVKYLRVEISESGDYRITLEAEPDPANDLVGESLKVPILIDRDSAQLLPQGTTIDFIDTPDRKGFEFRPPQDGPPDTSINLADARENFETELVREESEGTPLEEPPADVFRLVKYDAPPGKLGAYVTPDPMDGQRRPAIIWITGGDCNTVGDVWSREPEAMDQSASVYRKSGLVMMFPSLRGGNDNPGFKEGFFGEVDDVLAAAKYLAALPYVDPQRIYLGGHSTGATLALLAAECSGRFRAIFAFGPTDNVSGYGPSLNPYLMSDRQEIRLRSPGRWLHSITSPTFIFEGSGGNLTALDAMRKTSTNPQVKFFEIQGANHFNILGHTNQLIAQKILQDTGPKCNLAFTEVEVQLAE